MMKRQWLNEYPVGAPQEIDADTFTSCVELFERSVERFSDRPALASFDTVLNYAELAELSRQFGAYLQQVLGVGKGDRVAIMLPNLLQYQVALYGIMSIGAVTVNVNPMYTPRELQHQLIDSGASCIVVFSQTLPVLEQVLDATSIQHVIVTDMADLLGQPKYGTFVTEAGEYLRFNQLLEEGEKLARDAVSVDGDDILFLQYTGGTTGLSKGAVLTHRNLVANVLQFRSWFAGSLTDGEEIFTSALPLYHIFGLMVNGFCAVSLGGLSVLVTDPRNMEAFVQVFRDWRFTFMAGVNTLYNGLVNAPGFDELSLNLKFCVGGGASVQRAVAEQWFDKTGCHILEGYGLSETSPIVTLNRADTDHFTASIGLPVASTDISLRDEQGNEVAVGEAGELCARGPQVMRGYWGREEATREAFTDDGYFRTGDIACMNKEGYFRIVDRKKDMILVSGFNVFPNEIEDVIACCEGVFEVACIGVPSDKSGEAVKAFVVRKPGAPLNESDIIAHCRSQLTAYKVPRLVQFCEALPKSNVGKILRRELR